MKNWKDYFRDAWGKIKEKHFALEMKNGKKCFMRSKVKDRDIFVEINLGNEYLVDKIELPEDSVVLDVGAHIGVFSVYIAEKAGKVFAFEPVPENFKLLEKNIELNKLEKKVFSLRKAVLDKKGKIKIFLHKENVGGHSIYPCGKEFVEAETVSLKDFFGEKAIEKCDLLKIDVEGAEYNILYNLDKATFGKIERIAMECHNLKGEKQNTEAMAEFLRKKGFKVKEKKSLYNFTILFAEKIH